MKRKYLRCEYGKYDIRRNGFLTYATFEYKGLIRMCPFLIDTGCGITNISVRRIPMEYKESLKLKEEAILSGARARVSIGVNNTEAEVQSTLKLIKTGEIINCKLVSFEQDISRLVVSGFNVGDRTVMMSFDREGIPLLGMDILKDWDIHIGKSVISGKVIFLGCPRDRINPQYLEALEKEFRLGTTISSNHIHRELNKSSYLK